MLSRLPQLRHAAAVYSTLQEGINKNITQEDAAAKELDFFDRDDFFSSAAVASVRERFGVDALRVQLSKQLVSLTQRELPKMKEALDEVLAQVGGLTRCCKLLSCNSKWLFVSLLLHCIAIT
jgi:hypothetical protein